MRAPAALATNRELGRVSLGNGLHLLAALLSLLVAAPRAAAQWSPTGVPLCVNCGADLPTDHLVIPDGQGGLFAAWRDTRDYASTGTDVYLQRLTAGGYVAQGWPVDGLGICHATRDQNARWTASDGQGGALVTWIDQRGDNDIYVQRATGAGTVAPGWPENGVAATQAPFSQGGCVVTPDGAGGAFAAWDDFRNDPINERGDIYAQHFTATGAVSEGWPADGLPVCTDPGGQIFPELLSDGQGGVIVVWHDYRANAFDVYGTRLTGAGLAAGWPQDGRLLVPGRGRPLLLSDEGGGFFVACATQDAEFPGFVGEYWVQRFAFDGAVAPGWPEPGFLVCEASGPRDGLRVATDEAGGVLMTWYDYRTPGGEIYAARVLPNATLAPGWTPNGTLLSDRAGGGVKYDPAIAPDGAGGAYVAWVWETYAQPSYIQHLTARGQVAAGWPAFGVRVAPTLSQFHPQLVADGAGAAIVVWNERLAPRLGLYAQKFQLDGPVPTLLALSSANAEPGVVRLQWQGPDAAHLLATVERRTESGPGWLELGTVTADASGRLSYEDRAVEPGLRYAYRLRWREDGVEHMTDEAWVDVPRALELALQGLRPNPAVGELTVSFTLPTAEPARLALFDVSGRRVIEREVGTLGAGRHLLRLDDGAGIPPGIYWLRLSHGARSLLARGVVVR